jgi:hypothetical protein
VRAGLTLNTICDSDTAERVLGHAIAGVRGHYDDAANHMPAVRSALDQWGALLEACAARAS